MVEADTTVAPTTTVRPGTGSDRSTDCGESEPFDDPDKDGYGTCESGVIASDRNALLAAAEAAGLPSGLTCRVPARLFYGQTRTLTCMIIGDDGSEGAWTVEVQFDGTFVAPPSYQQTLGPLILDQATIDWWLSESADDQKLDCTVGYRTVIVLLPRTDERTYDYLCAGGPIGPERTGEQLSNAEFDSVLASPAAAWARFPSSETFEALATAARGLIESTRPFPTTVELTSDMVFGALRNLATYPGTDVEVASAIETLTPVSPNLPFVLRDGSFSVGPEAPAGDYRTVRSVTNCYWETLNSRGEINDNNFVTAAPQVIMTIQANDFAVNSEHCGPWIST